MNEIIAKVDEKLSHLMWALAINGLVLLFLAVLVFVSDFMTRLLIALGVLVIAYSFIYGAYKVYSIRKIFKL
ncbi:MAG: hypothetical protein WCO55_00245 [Candidatus Falkowbacteria bacterium]